MAGHGGPILSLAVAPDGLTAYSGGQDKTIRVWNLGEGKLLRTLNGPMPVTALAIASGGTTLFSGGAGWDHSLARCCRWPRASCAARTHGRRDGPGGPCEFFGRPADCFGLRRRHRARIWTFVISDACSKPDRRCVARPVTRERCERSRSRRTGRRSSPAATTGLFGSWGVTDGKAQGAALATGHAGPVLPSP